MPSSEGDQLVGETKQVEVGVQPLPFMSMPPGAQNSFEVDLGLTICRFSTTASIIFLGCLEANAGLVA